MPNFAKLLKDEISRVARKEQRTETTALKKSSANYRSEIAALKRRLAALEAQIKKLAKTTARSAGTAARAGEDEEGPRLRFSADRLRARRERLGLSAAEMGKLVGVSSQTIYNWETGKARPRAAQLTALAAARKLGKREVTAKLGGE
jgi:DNA-binding XRE family transcriptional regulator